MFKRIKRKAAGLAPLLILTSPLAWQAGPAAVSAAEAEKLTSAMLEQVVDRAAAESMAAWHIPGAAVVVTKGETVLFSKGYGLADVAKQMPMDTAKTIVRMGSLTKPLTAAAALQLVEQGRVSLDQEVNRYLTAYQVSSDHAPFTLHHLLTHTAGLDQAVYRVNGVTESSTPSAESFLREYVSEQPPIRQPGEKHEYSNAGYGLIGSLVEQVSGQPLESYYRQHLLNPLQMNSASLRLPVDHPHLAKSYTYNQGSYMGAAIPTFPCLDPEH